jgi:hypothetical protein
VERVRQSLIAAVRLSQAVGEPCSARLVIISLDKFSARTRADEESNRASL